MCIFYIVIKKIFITTRHFKNFLMLENIEEEVNVELIKNSKYYECIQEFISKLRI